MDTLHLVSIFIEGIIATLALLAILKGKTYMCGLLIGRRTLFGLHNLQKQKVDPLFRSQTCIPLAR